MNIRTTALRTLLMTAAIGLGAGPVHARDHQSGVLYDNGGERIGTISVRDAARGGVLLRIEAEGLPSGWHGMHFHEVGDCNDPAFKSAGGHVHAEKPVVHGFLVEGANDDGDLPNLYVNEDGSATVEFYSNFVSLDGQYDLAALHDADGSALIIHVDPDDYETQPIGGAGARIACAIIP